MSALTLDIASKPVDTHLGRGAISLRNFLVVFVQLALLALVLRQFKIENTGFLHLALLTFGGFAIHAFLPMNYRLRFFLAVSLVGTGLVLGFTNALWVFAIGLLLIGICHLPISARVRTVLLVLAGVVLIALRAKWVPSGLPDLIWPVLGSMFMFRLAVYCYELNHDSSPATPESTLSYFFMLPNVCFPLFPVVDYKTFRRNYYDEDAYRTYQLGVDWMVRGVIHLILYRFVYLHLTLDPLELTQPGELLQYLISTFLLYLRISGQFHLVIGMLHLFGFRLPETHHLYLLSSSFTDFWRRINIYWKDFMMKLVYYPSFFRLKRLGQNRALIGATIIVFVVTWILHSYQWFWLRGGFPIELPDVLFWGILGALVLFGSLREMKRSRKRKMRTGATAALFMGLKTVAFFCLMCLLWSLWSAESVMGWVTMWMIVGSITLKEVFWLVGLIVIGLAIAILTRWALEGGQKKSPSSHKPIYSSALLLIVLLVGSVAFYERFMPRLAATVRSLQGSSLNATDAAIQHKGYYEKLDSDSRLSAELSSIESQKPENWVGLNETEAYQQRHDFLGFELKPGAKIQFQRQPLTVNQSGIRGREFSVAKPAGTYRIAILGPSHVMGSGVGDGETFADFLEQGLNRANAGSNLRFEVMNFGVAGYALTQQLAMLEDRVLRFKPDAVFITDSPGGKTAVAGHLLNVINDERAIPYPELDEMVNRVGLKALANEGVPVPFAPTRSVLAKVGIKSRMPWSEADRRMRMLSADVVEWTIARIGKVSLENGAVPVFVALDNVNDPPTFEVPALKSAERNSFVVFNLFDVWKGRDKSAIRIVPWDQHPNAAGNRIIAERLQALIEQHRSELHLPSNMQKASAVQN